MTDQQRYCMRCGRPAVRGDSETEEIWRCPNQHGIVYQAALPEAPPAEQAATAPEEPGEEHTGQDDDEAHGDREEDARPEPRARAPAAHRGPPARKKPVKAAKRK